MTRSESRARTHRRGTASVEVVMMLPFFILVFAGLYYMHGLYAGRQLALTRARACGWAYAKVGCTGPRPAECPGPEGADGGAELNPDEAGGGAADGVIDGLESIPVIGGLLAAPVKALFGEPLTTQARHAIVQPGPNLGPDSFTVRGRYFTLCNTVRKTWGTVAHDIFCGFANELIGGFPGC